MNLQNTFSFLHSHAPSFKKSELLPRKQNLTLANTLIFKTPQSGITSSLFLFLSAYEKSEYLYIDYSDWLLGGVGVGDFVNELGAFLARCADIKIVVIENACGAMEVSRKEGVSYLLTLCPSEQEILHSEHYKGFASVFFFPLDFEEYILFKRSSTGLVFNDFMRESTLPSIASSDTQPSHLDMQQAITSLIPHTTKRQIFTSYLSYQSVGVSVYHLYNLLRKKTKISKDTFYATTKQLEREMLLFLLPKFAHPKDNRRVYFIDFNLPKAIKIQTDIKKTVQNALLLELLKHKTYLMLHTPHIYYTDELDFYIPSKHIGILTMLFRELDEIKEHIWYIDAMIDAEKEQLERIYIITIDKEHSGYKQVVNGVSYQVLTFWEFASL